MTAIEVPWDVMGCRGLRVHTVRLAWDPLGLPLLLVIGCPALSCGAMGPPVALHCN